jgi:hypothetical protein
MEFKLLAPLNKSPTFKQYEDAESKGFRGRWHSEPLGLWTLSIFCNSNELENTTFQKLGLFSCLGRGKKTPILLGPLKRANQELHSIIGSFWLRLPLCMGRNRVSPSHQLKTEIDPVSEKCFLVIYNFGRGTKSTNPVILSVTRTICRYYKLISWRIMVTKRPISLCTKCPIKLSGV